MLKKVFLVVLFSLISISAYALDKEMLSCLPDTLGEYKAAKGFTTEELKDNVTSVSRQYQREGDKAKVSVWKIPGDKEIWPF